MRPIILGILSALFFAVTFVFNRKMELAGGSWLWSASLRYFFMVPLLLALVLYRRNLAPVLALMKEQPGRWMLWSTVGFGFFYAPLCFAAAYSPGWLVAGTWQVTIISGALLAPLFWETVQTAHGPQLIRSPIHFKGLAMAILILAGIFVLQLDQAKMISGAEAALGILPIFIASFAYPLGNRKMMELCAGQLDVFQRVLGMTLASLPFWIIIGGLGLITSGLPGQGQVLQSLLVAVSSGVIATLLFFRATDLVRGDSAKLAGVEATQSMEVLFALIGEVLLLSAPLPTALSWCGIVILIGGMIAHSYVSNRS